MDEIWGCFSSLSEAEENTVHRPPPPIATITTTTATATSLLTATIPNHNRSHNPPPTVSTNTNTNNANANANANTKKNYNAQIVLSPAGSTGTINSNSTTRSNHSNKSGVSIVQAMAAARRKRAMSPPVKVPMSCGSGNETTLRTTAGNHHDDPINSLQLPSLQESRNDDHNHNHQRRQGQDVEVVSVVEVKDGQDGEELEVSLTSTNELNLNMNMNLDLNLNLNLNRNLPPIFDKVEMARAGMRTNDDETSPPISITTRSTLDSQPFPQTATIVTALEQQADQIILEAQMASLQMKINANPSNYNNQNNNNNDHLYLPDDPQKRDLIQQALDRAASKSKMAAAQAISSGSGVTSPNSHFKVVDEEEDTLEENKNIKNNNNINKNARNEPPLPPKFRTTKEVLELASTRLKESQEHQSLMMSTPTTPKSQIMTNNTLAPANTAATTPKTPVGIGIGGGGGGGRFNPHSRQNQILHTVLSPTESDVASIDDFEKAVGRLPSRLKESEKLPREKILSRLDGVIQSPVPIPAVEGNTSNSSVVSPLQSPTTRAMTTQFEEDNSSIASNSNNNNNNHKKVKTVVIQSIEPVIQSEGGDNSNDGSYGGWLNYFWSDNGLETNYYHNKITSLDESGDSLAPLSCGSQRVPVPEELPAMATSLVKVASGPMTYVEAAIDAQEIDPRMPDWVDNQFSIRENLPKDGTYRLGESRTVIVHEIMRGNWSWCTAWSPDGGQLAMATENHHLAVVDTCSSAVWRVTHDKKVKEPSKQDTVHSIRSIAWGMQFIAIGGTGNAVSLLAPTKPYPILHSITQTGFVGTLDWLTGTTNTLLIGSRLGKAMIVKIGGMAEKQSSTTVDPHNNEIQSTIVHTIDRQRAWINAVKFSPGGSAFAVGDSKGILGVYTFEDEPGQPMKVSNVANFKLEDSILDIEWSPGGEWLYAGGEDFAVTVISTQLWEAVHRIKRGRWVQFISSSMGGSHVAVGGVTSEVSILDVERGWDTAINVSLKGLVPLSARWHPQDQYLVLTGQDNSIVAIETTNARYVSGHFLRSVSPICCIEFSPDGRMAAIGNEAGVLTIFKLSGTTFITSYEMILDSHGSLSIEWSLNGSFLAVETGNKVVIVSQSSALPPGSAPPNASGFSVAKVIRDLGAVHDIAVDPQCRFVAVSGAKTRILDATANFKCVQEIENPGMTLANSWSPDGSWFATVGKDQHLLIYDTSPEKISEWRVVFTVQTKQSALALAWGPIMVGGLQYCAYGGADKKVYIMEIRTKERTWETVLRIPRDGIIYDLDWNAEGLVAAAIGNGTVTVMDLSYLQSGWAVNEMDYNWQRQASTCFTEIRRNRGKNCMTTVRWIPSAPGSDSLLAVGGTDGEVEIVDLTMRERCSGFLKVAAAI